VDASQRRQGGRIVGRLGGQFGGACEHRNGLRRSRAAELAEEVAQLHL
jgi:hypothetical protein